MSDNGGPAFPPPSGPPLEGPTPGGDDAGAPAAGPPEWTRRVVTLPIALALTLAVIAVIAFVIARGGDDTEATSTTTSAATTTASTVTATSAAPTTAPATTIASTTIASTTVPATTVPAPTSAPTTAPATTEPATTTPPSTEPATTAPTETTATTASDGRVVTIDARREACRFGPDCLVAGFTLSGFGRLPATFTCEFANGSRFSYPLGRLTRVDQACTTGNPRDSITIEVDGVRSDTATFANSR